MNQEIADATEYMVCKESFVLPINKAEAELYSKALNDGVPMIEIRGRKISIYSILFVIPASDYEDTLMEKRGFVRCPENQHWTKKYGKKCNPDNASPNGGSCYY